MLNAQEVINYLDGISNDAFKMSSKLPESISNPELLLGMSSGPVRHLFNNICEITKPTTYLEVGLYAGSTFVSSLYGNSNNVIAAYGIDNWSEFAGREKGRKEECLRNVEKFLIPDYGNKIIIYDEDCWQIDLNKIEHRINVFFYDGCHTPDLQEKALKYFRPVLDDTFIYIVDDWNYPCVQFGTCNGIVNNKYKILYKRDLLTPDKESISLTSWWNSLFIGILQKGE